MGGRGKRDRRSSDQVELDNRWWRVDSADQTLLANAISKDPASKWSVDKAIYEVDTEALLRGAHVQDLLGPVSLARVARLRP